MKDEEITKSSSFDHRSSSSSRTRSKPKLSIDDTSDNGVFETEISDEEEPAASKMNKFVTAAVTTGKELQRKRKQQPCANDVSESLVVTTDVIKRKKRIAAQSAQEVQLVPTFLKQPPLVPAAAATTAVSNNSPAAAAGAAAGSLLVTGTPRTGLSDTTMLTTTSIPTPFITTKTSAADDNVISSTLSTVKPREVSSVATSTAMARSPLPPDPATAIANVARGSSIGRGTTITSSSSSTPKLLLEEARNRQQQQQQQQQQLVDEVERESGKQLQVRKVLMDKLDTIMNHVLKDDIMMSKRQQQEQQSRNRITHKFFNTNTYNLQQIDWSGSFITNEENRYDFYDSDEENETSFIGSFPIFPEDFKQGQQPWPLSWWGIVEPSPDIIRAHFPKGEEEQGSGVVAASATKDSTKDSSGTIPTTKQSGQQARSYNTDYHYNPNYYHSRPYDNTMGPPQGRLPPPSYYPPRPPYFHGGGPPPLASSATIGPSSYGRGRPGGGDFGMYYGGGNGIGPYETAAYPRSYHPSTVTSSRPKEGHSGTGTSVSNKPHRPNK